MTTIHHWLIEGKYNVKTPFPLIPKAICFKCNLRLDKEFTFCPHCGDNFGEKFAAVLNNYKELKNNYNLEESKKFKEFKDDCLDHVGLKDHPKADDIFNYAWEQGHASGYAEVLSILIELSNLFKR